MLPIALKPEPVGAPFDFHTEVRVPGYGALHELVGRPSEPRPGPKRVAIAVRVRDIPSDKLHPYWRRSIDALHAAYDGTCAYLGVRIARVFHPTVDHFLAKAKHHPVLAYEWCNYRLACSHVNGCKGDQTGLLDPATIRDDWFFLNLGNYEVHANPELDPNIRARVTDTCARLQLNAPPCIDIRQGLVSDYLGLTPGLPPLPFGYLERESPFIARELRRQGCLHPADQP